MQSDTFITDVKKITIICISISKWNIFKTFNNRKYIDKALKQQSPGNQI